MSVFITGSALTSPSEYPSLVPSAVRIAFSTHPGELSFALTLIYFTPYYLFLLLLLLISLLVVSYLTPYCYLFHSLLLLISLLVVTHFMPCYLLSSLLLISLSILFALHGWAY